MTPQQFLNEIKNGTPGPLYLFVGPEMYRRRVCRSRLIESFLPEELREEGISRHDMDEVGIREVMDDASSFSLFASRRVILASSAEAVLPRGNAKDVDSASVAALQDYARNPSPDVVILFDARRVTFENDDKTKLDRLRKFFSVARQVEFQPYSTEEARRLAADLAQRSGLKVAPPVLDSLIEALGADAARLATEIEKLSLFTGGQRPVTEQDIAALTPDARESTIFLLVNALSRGDRQASLDIVETLVRDGEYLPLALTFLASQFRFALAAREEGLRTPQQIQGQFAKMGIPMWPSRAQQVQQTLAAFDRKRLDTAVAAVYEADKGFRDRSPDDRIVMEKLIFALTR